QPFRTALRLEPAEADPSPQPTQLRKLTARPFLRRGPPAEARAPLQAILAHGPDPEAGWLLSRALPQEGDRAGARAALAQAGSYRAENPLEAEPAPYLGEARCEPCHPAIFRDSLASRHTRSYYRGAQLKQLPRPDRPLPDADEPEVIHTILE